MEEGSNPFTMRNLGAGKILSFCLYLVISMLIVWQRYNVHPGIDIPLDILNDVIWTTVFFALLIIFDYIISDASVLLAKFNWVLKLKNIFPIHRLFKRKIIITNFLVSSLAAIYFFNVAAFYEMKSDYVEDLKYFSMIGFSWFLMVILVLFIIEFITILCFFLLGRSRH